MLDWETGVVLAGTVGMLFICYLASKEGTTRDADESLFGKIFLVMVTIMAIGLFGSTKSGNFEDSNHGSEKETSVERTEVKANGKYYKYVGKANGGEMGNDDSIIVDDNGDKYILVEK